MTSGRYFSDRQVYIVAGAPRINLIGQVSYPPCQLTGWNFIFAVNSEKEPNCSKNKMLCYNMNEIRINHLEI